MRHHSASAHTSLQERELQWLLESLQESLASLKEGLEECVALLAPKEPGSTLVLSSLRSESVKGFVTRVGATLRKCVSLGDVNNNLFIPPFWVSRIHSLLVSLVLFQQPRPSCLTC